MGIRTVCSAAFSLLPEQAQNPGNLANCQKAHAPPPAHCLSDRERYGLRPPHAGGRNGHGIIATGMAQ